MGAIAMWENLGAFYPHHVRARRFWICWRRFIWD